MKICQGCDSAGLSLIVSLGAMPPVNAFLTPSQIADEQKFPLDVYFCERCSLVQLSPTVDPKLLFSDYNHLSSASKTTAAYLTSLAATLTEELNITSASKILEIGSNDGTLLTRFKSVTPHLVGVDPARNVTEKAAESGIPLWVDFFSSRLAEDIQHDLGQFDVILAINVVAHTPSFVDLFAGVKKLLQPGGYFVMECAHVLPTILRGEIDTIYHEHVYCFSLHALSHACERVGLTIVDAQKISTQGGSLRLLMQATSKNNLIKPSVSELLREEASAGVNRLATYAGIAPAAGMLRENLRAKLQALRSSHGKVIGLGAPARGVVLMNYCELSTHDLALVIDDTPLKQGKLVPGRHIPVFDWTKIARDEDVACLMLSWNYRREVLAKLRSRTKTARILIPLPTMEEITLE